MQLPWQEYLETHPGGYQYSRFYERYGRWLQCVSVTMRQEHHAGQKSSVDLKTPRRFRLHARILRSSLGRRCLERHAGPSSLGGSGVNRQDGRAVFSTGLLEGSQLRPESRGNSPR